MQGRAEAGAAAREFDAFGFLARFGAGDLSPRADGGLRDPQPGLPEAAEPVQRDAPGLGLRPAGDRHDLRHPDPRDRPVDRRHRWPSPASLRPPSPRAGSSEPLCRRRRGRRRWAGAGSWPCWPPCAVGTGRRAGSRALAITKLKVPPFVVTLGGMSAFRGAGTAASPVAGRSAASTRAIAWWGQGLMWAPYPSP